jgi:hypothetical protein
MSLDEKKDYEEREFQRKVFGISNLTRRVLVKYVQKKTDEGKPVSKKELLRKLFKRGK